MPHGSVRRSRYAQTRAPHDSITSTHESPLANSGACRHEGQVHEKGENKRTREGKHSVLGNVGGRSTVYYCSPLDFCIGDQIRIVKAEKGSKSRGRQTDAYTATALPTRSTTLNLLCLLTVPNCLVSITSNERTIRAGGGGARVTHARFLRCSDVVPRLSHFSSFSRG